MAASSSEQRNLPLFCFSVLHSHLNGGSPCHAPAIPSQSCPLFVTWTINKDKQLRGCIGTFSPHQLEEGLREYALTSALRDSRFRPIGQDELPRLQCAVSLLVDFEAAANYLDWEIGVHGIWIEFTNERGSKQTATYLPEVMPEQGWDKMQAIDSLLRKGAYRAAITEDFRRSIRLTRYKSVKTSVSYDEWRKWQEAQSA